MQEQEIKNLLIKYQAGECTDAEKAFLEDWYAAWNQKVPVNLTAQELEDDLKLISQNTRTLKESRSVALWPRITVAASLLFMVGFSAYFILKPAAPVQVANKITHDVAPGGNKAILTLANGQKISLTDAQNGTVARQGQAAINKTADGDLLYAATNTTPDKEPAVNTLATPNGGKFHLTLADGTGVWLNAASSIKYPAAFTGNKREVEITGEVYFEVAHDKTKPFSVLANNQTVNVLGTHFNINAYNNEQFTKTTLLQGSVKIGYNGQTVYLKPGDQAQTSAAGILVDKTINEEGVIAWKEGFFDFKKADIKTIMRQAIRWYDVNVIYKGKIDNNLYTGRISRNVNLSELLNILKIAGLNSSIEGKNIIITD
jgi:transmembrane sensor